jgi:hypothetical protein
MTAYAHPKRSLFGLLLGLFILALLLGASAFAAPKVASPRPAESLPPASLFAEDLPSTLGLGCRLVASPLAFQDAQADSIEVTSRLQNAGRKAASVHALQVSWFGPYALTGLRIGSVDAKIEPAHSPAIISLDGSDAVLEPAAEPILASLRFTRIAGEGSWRPGPTVVLTREGCELALGVEPVATCDLRVDGPTIDSTEKNLVRYELSNAGNLPLTLSALELDWPIEANGALIGLKLEGAGQPTVDPLRSSPIKRPPAVISLSQAFGSPVVLASKASLRLALRFENAAAARNYNLTVITGAGCRTNRSTWLSNTSCGTEFKRFKIERRSASMLLANSRGITQALQSLSLLWEPDYNGPLSEIMIDGARILAKPIERSPAIIELPRDLQIGPEQSVEVKLIFDPSRVGPSSGLTSAAVSEAGPGAPLKPEPLPMATDDRPGGTQLSGGDFTIVAQFRGACQAVLTTLHGEDDLGCRVTAGELLRDERSPASDASVTLTNAGAEAVLARLSIAWPVHNGKLIGVWLDQVKLLDKSEAHRTEALLLRPGSQALLPSKQPRVLRLEFERPAARAGYALGLGFNDRQGSPCSELVVTSPPVTPDCRLGLSGGGQNSPRVLPDGKTAELDLVSLGLDALELESINLDWPTNGGMNLMRLQGLALIYSGEREITLLRSPDQRPPVQIRGASLPEVATLAPEGRAVLEMKFNEIRDPASFEAALKVSMAFVEGCRVAYPPGGNVALPKRIKLEALIEKLPAAEGGVYGLWQVRDVSSSRPYIIEVDRGTEFVPSNITPHDGDIVAIEAAELPSANMAERITFLASRPERKFVGKVSSMESVSPPALPTWIQVDERRVAIESGFTVIDRPDELGVGATVVVQGIQGLNGDFVALRIELVYALREVERPITLAGAVQAILPAEGSPFQGTRAIWIIDEFEVHVSELVSATDPMPGAIVEISGRAIGNRVRAEKATARPVPVASRHLSGRILDLPVDGLRGVWTVNIARVGPAQPITFTVGSVGVVDTRRAPALVDMLVDVTLRQDDRGRRQALRVRTDWP